MIRVIWIWFGMLNPSQKHWQVTLNRGLLKIYIYNNPRGDCYPGASHNMIHISQDLTNIFSSRPWVTQPCGWRWTTGTGALETNHTWKLCEIRVATNHPNTFQVESFWGKLQPAIAHGCFWMFGYNGCISSHFSFSADSCWKKVTDDLAVPLFRSES